MHAAPAYADVVIRHNESVAIMAAMRWAVMATAALAAVLLFYIAQAMLRMVMHVPHA